MVSMLLMLVRRRRGNAVMMGRRRVMRRWRGRSRVRMRIVMVWGRRSGSSWCRVTMVIRGRGWRRRRCVVRMFNRRSSMGWTRGSSLSRGRRMLRRERGINRTPTNTRVRRARLVDTRIFPRPLDSTSLLTLPPADRSSCTLRRNAPARFPSVPVALSVTISVSLSVPFALLSLQLFLLIIIFLVIV